MTGLRRVRPRQPLDFTQPIALMLLAIVDHIMDTDEVNAIVNQLLDALPSGSYLTLTHTTAEVDGDVMLDGVRRYNENGATPPLTVRSLQEIARFFDRLELLAPGLVSCSLWRPDPSQLGAPVEVDLFGAVGRKP
ncbi:MAG: SAM-dependent methyltransferase [Pseudonocardiaceae bacterium]